MLLYGICSILIARRIGPQQTGYLAWFVTGTSSFSMFADVLGIYYSNAYLMAREGPRLDAGVTRATTLMYGAGLGVLVGVLFSFVAPIRRLAFPGFLDAGWAPLLFWTLLGQSVLFQIRSLFLGSRSFILLGLVTLAKSGGYGVIAAILVYSLGWDRATQLALVQAIVIWACVVASFLFFVARGVARPSLAYLTACMNVGWRAAGINWLSYLHLRVDQFMVEWLLGARDLGLYAVAVAFGEVTNQVPGMIGAVVFPITAGEPDKAKAARDSVRRTLWLMAAAAVVVTPVGIFASKLIHVLYGDAFLGAELLLRVYLPAVVFLSGVLVLNHHVSALGYPPFQALTTALGCILNVVLNLWFLPRIGVVGASLASSISYAFWFAMLLGYVWREGSAAGKDQPHAAVTSS